MDNETRSILQQILDLDADNRKAIAQLSAFNALQNHVIMALLSHMNAGTKFAPGFRDSYETVRSAALTYMSITDSPSDIDAFLNVLDEKFL